MTDHERIVYIGIGLTVATLLFVFIFGMVAGTSTFIT